jgi:predicted dehydrogenase
MSDVTEKVKVALIGCGGFSREYVQGGVQRSELLEVVACYDVVGSEAAQAAEKFGARQCASFEQAVAADGVEAALLITPNHVHREQAVAALEAGKHVFVEKPMANTVAEGLAMVRAAERAERILMVGHVTRRYPAFRVVQEALRSGRLGRPISGEANFSHGAGRVLPRDSWRADPARCPGLPLNVLGVHLVDVLNMLFGRPRIVAALHRRAVVATNDDCTATLVAYDEPVTATVVSHYSVPRVHELRIIGTEAVAEVHDFGAQFVLRGSKQVIEQREMSGGGLDDELRVFGRAVRYGEAVETDGRAGLEALAVVEASVISARESRFVRIDELLEGF